MPDRQANRRTFNCFAAASATAYLLESTSAATETATPLKPNYLLGSCMYGYMQLDEILPETRRVGAKAIDIWPKVHGNQREQLGELGEEKFMQMLKQHDVTLGCITQYPLGPLGLQNEMRLASRLGCETIVTGSVGPKDRTGSELKRAVSEFCEKMKPHLDIAEETGVTIAIENHANSLIDSPDSLKWLAELAHNEKLGIALAPYHLPQDDNLLADLIRTLGSAIQVFYAWQHGMGCMEKLPKEQELLQLPGRGSLDFAPLISALKEIQYSGWTEIFMHPVPRGISIHETAAEVSAEINRSRDYLSKLGW